MPPSSLYQQIKRRSLALSEIRSTKPTQWRTQGAESKACTMLAVQCYDAILTLVFIFSCMPRRLVEASPASWVAVYADLGKGKLSALVTLTAAAGYVSLTLQSLAPLKPVEPAFSFLIKATHHRAATSHTQHDDVLITHSGSSWPRLSALQYISERSRQPV